MRKIIEFFKENRIGAIVGLLYAVFGIILVNVLFTIKPFHIFESILTIIGIIYIPFLSVFWFVTNFLFLIFGSYILSWIITTIFFVCFGASTQAIIRTQPKKNTLIFFVVIALFLIIFYLLIQPRGPTPLNRCYLGTEFQCIDYLLKNDSVRLKIKSPFNSVLDSVNINLFNPTNNEEYSCIGPNSATISNWQPNKIQDFEFNNCDFKRNIKKGEKAKVVIKINYQIGNEGRESIGELYAVVQ